jgi:pimeloyl-ACP methyl ester carboxylesterase
VNQTKAEANRRLAVVLVHGLFSDPEAWDSMATLISDDPRLAEVEVRRFAYDSALTTRRLHRQTPSLDSVADSLHTFLRHNVEEPEAALVCHSQGGLIALRFLARRLQDANAWDGPEIRLLLMYATPQQGSTFGRRVRRVFFDDHAQARSLKPFDQATADSIRAVMTHTTNLTGTLSDLVVAAVAGTTDGIATPASARGYWEIVETVPGDHSSIIRPASRDEASYQVLRRRLRGVLEAPVVNLTATEQDRTRLQWLEIAIEVSAQLKFAHWDAAFGGLVRTSYALPATVLRELHDFSAWLLGRNLPAGQPELRLALDTVQNVLVDLLDTFNRHTDAVNVNGEESWVRVHKWYSAGGFNQHYDRDLRAYSKHVNLLFNLTLELTRATQWFCDVVRRDLDPSFLFKEGALLLEAGPFADGDTRILRPCYEEDDFTKGSPPYTTLEAFRASKRFQREPSEQEAYGAGDPPQELTKSQQLERQMVERQLADLESELDVFREWKSSASRQSLVDALAYGRASELIAAQGFRAPIWETDWHLRFQTREGEVTLTIERDSGEILREHPWVEDTSAEAVFQALDDSMQSLGEHLGPGLFLPTRCIEEAADALIFAARYRSQALNQGSELFVDLIEYVDGWYIAERGLFPVEHPFYLVARDRMDEMDWEDHLSAKGWDGVHRAMAIARALYS